MRFNKYGRELDLILLLSDNALHSAQELAERLDITRRNVYNYLEYLRECGFILIKCGTNYRLDRSSPFFRRLHENIALTEEEAAYVVRLVESVGRKRFVAESVRAKLVRQFNLADRSDPTLMQRLNRNLSTLKAAIAQKRMVTLHDYSSPHSGSVSDRIVEPFMLMNDGRDARCHELKTHVNKTFKVSRMASVELLDVPWICEMQHKQLYTDIFMFSGEERHHVVLSLGQLSHNLMVEEYPASVACIHPSDEQGRWTFEADVVSLLGIGRFVLGLYDDIRVLGDDDFKTYIQGKIEQFHHADAAKQDTDF